MIQVNILEQLIIFYNILIKNKNILFILIFSFVSLLGLIFASNLKNKKIVKIIYFVLYSLIFGYLIYTYHKEILNLLDYLMNNIFLFLFFPNLAIYILVLIIINALVIKSTISFEESKIKKIINIIFFTIFNIIFYLIINNIIDNNVNVYEQLSIYTNSNLLNLIELSMKLFVIWLIILLLIRIINKINMYTLNRKFVNNNLILNDSNIEIGFDNSNFVEKDFENKITFDDRKKEKIDYLEITSNLANKNNYNIYNDYINIEPIKKCKIESNILLDKKEMENKFVNKEIKNYSENNVYTDNSYHFFDTNVKKGNDDLQISKSINLENDNLENNRNIIFKNELPTLDEILDNNKENFVVQEQNPSFNDNLNNNLNNNLEINLSSYDFIFEKFEENETIKEEMPNIFSSNNNYLQTITSEIEKLKNNQVDKKQIKEVYDKILINEDNLSLSDYNYLINRLLELKK